MSSSGAIQRASLSDYLAAERTLLAWVRTGLALMGFGFVVARFGLFLQQLAAVRQNAIEHTSGLSIWFGTALIAAGVIVSLGSGWYHVRSVRSMEQGSYGSSRSVLPAAAIAVFLGLVGISMAIYLLSVRTTTNSYSHPRETIMTADAAGNGIVSVPSNHSVDQTVEKLATILKSKGVTLFAVVDHSGEAEKVGMKMRPTKLLIFGNPKAGTPLMLAAPSIAIDLPLKILVWEDAQGKAWLSYNSPEFLAQRYGLPHELLQNIAVVATLAAAAGQ